MISEPSSAILRPMTEDIPRTGPEAILHKLKTIDLEALEAEQREVIKSKKKTKRLSLIHI